MSGFNEVDVSKILKPEPPANFIDVNSLEHTEHICHCGKKYSSVRNLNRHAKFECGGKPPRFGCSYCAYGSKRKDDLRRHVQRMHPNCDFKFDLIDNILDM